MSILSASHIAPKLCDWSILTEGNCIIYSDYLNYKKDVAKYNPKYLLCVPKLLLMHRDDYLKSLNKRNDKFKYWHDVFYKISESYVKLEDKRNKNLFEVLKKLLFKICNIVGIEFVFGKILKEINLRKNANIIAFGACLDVGVEILFQVIGTKLLINYGLTEAGTLTYINLQNRRLGSVGKVNPAISLIVCDPETNKRLPANTIGLIKAKGSQIMKGYFKNEEATKGIFDSEGYFSTGDMGYLSEDNFLFFKGRYKNVIVLNNGENINPEPLEELCKNSKFVSQIMLLGQDKSYLTAIIVPNEGYGNINNFKKEVIIDINNIIGNAKYFKWIHQIKDVLFADEPFTQENGLLTKKYSLNRSLIYEKYSGLIEEMYKNEYL